MAIEIKYKNGLVASLENNQRATLYTRDKCMEDDVVVEASYDLQNKIITVNGNYTADDGYDGLNEVVVNIPAPALQTKEVTPGDEAQQIFPDSGVDGLSSVTVKAVPTEEKSVAPSTEAQEVTPEAGKYLNKVTVGAIGIESKTVTPTTSFQEVFPSTGKYLSSVTVEAIQTEEKTVKSNGTVEPTAGKFLSKVIVDVPATKFSLQNKIVTKNGEYTADSEYDGLSKVVVNVPMPNDYAGTIKIFSEISFTIDGVEYQAEEGMTWADWVASEYNTGGYSIHNGLINLGTTYSVYLNGSFVYQTNTITTNGSYTHGTFNNGTGGSN